MGKMGWAVETLTGDTIGFINGKMEEMAPQTAFAVMPTSSLM
jgi:hypothetical protein